MNDGAGVAISPHRSDVIFCVGNVYNSAYFVAVSHTADDGATWEHDTIPSGTRGWAVAFDPFDSNRVYIGGDSAYSYPCLLITTDMGATWTSSRAGLSGVVYALAAVPHTSGLIYAGTSSGVYKSTDAGANWTRTSLTAATRALVVYPTAPHAMVYAGTYGSGVYSTADEGAVWEPMNSGLTNLKVISLACRDEEQPVLFAGTEGGSVFRTGPQTGLAGPNQTGRVRPVLSIVPNPARGSARLELADRVTLPAKAGLYDPAGRLVLDLSPRLAQHGSSGFTFSTGKIPAGIYFVRVETGTQTNVARLEVVE